MAKLESIVKHLFRDYKYQKGQVFNFDSFEKDGILFFVLVCITSEELKDYLNNLVNFALSHIKSFIYEDKDSLLNVMGNSIIYSGDELVKYLKNKHLPMGDVDYHACIIGIKQNVIYVYIDGNLNVIINRDKEQLLLNQDLKPSFYGSGFLEDGDKIVIGLSDDLRDFNLLDYVNNNLEPNFSFLLLFYGNKNYNYNSLVNKFDHGSKNYEEININTSNELNKKYFLSQGINSIISNILVFLKKKYLLFVSYINSKNAKKSLSIFGRKLLKLYEAYMNLTSNFLDYLFTKIYGNNNLKINRFKNSFLKRILQYSFILVLIIFLFIYGLNQNGNFSSKSNNTPNENLINNANIKKWEDAKFSLDKKYIDLLESVKDLNLNRFDFLKQEIFNEISQIENESWVDKNFLNSLKDKVISSEDLIYKNHVISKMDEIYSVTQDLGAVDIIDIDLVGNYLYALDRLNSRILVSNPLGFKFDIFVTDQDYKSLKNISCNNKECYLIDDEKGIAILNLNTRKISKFSGLQNAGKGVKELYIFNVGDIEYIYTLNPQESKIYRYKRVGDGISQPEVWNKDIGFGNDTVDFTIDGNIYELSSNGSLRKFYAGKLDNSFHGISNVPLNLQGNLSIAMTPARNPSPGVVNRVYISDPINERIVVLNKDLDSNGKMNYIGAFKYRGPSLDIVNFKNIKEIVLSDDEKYLYCLVNNTVVKFIVTDLF